MQPQLPVHIKARSIAIWVCIAGVLALGVWLWGWVILFEVVIMGPIYYIIAERMQKRDAQ